MEETLKQYRRRIRLGEINPLVSECVPLSEAARAHELLERGQYAGRVVLVTGFLPG